MFGDFGCFLLEKDAMKELAKICLKLLFTLDVSTADGVSVLVPHQ